MVTSQLSSTRPLGNFPPVLLCKGKHTTPAMFPPQYYPTSDTRCVGFPHTVQFCDTSWMSCYLTQFSHDLLEDGQIPQVRAPSGLLQRMLKDTTHPSMRRHTGLGAGGSWAQELLTSRSWGCTTLQGWGCFLIHQPGSYLNPVLLSFWGF